jgi:hypothetical protein
MAVYLIQAGSGGPVKIGAARNPAMRLQTLQTSHHETLRLVRVVEGNSVVERWFHKRFSSHRIRGEWFRFAPDMLTVTPPHLEPDGPRHRYGPRVSIENEVAVAISNLGGATEVALALGVVPSAVRNWRRLGAFPLHFSLDLLKLARRRRVKRDESRISMPEPGRSGRRYPPEN